MNSRFQRRSLKPTYDPTMIRGGAREISARLAAFRRMARQGRRLGAPPGPPTGWTNDRSELKYLDIASANYACDTTGSVTALNLIGQGDDVNTRQGRQVTLKSIRIHGMIAPVDNTTVNNYVRVMLIWDNSPNSAATVPAITDILNASTSITSTNLNNRVRFTVLRDWKETIGGLDNTATQATAQSPSVSEIDWYVNLKNALTTYSGTGSTIANISTGSLLMVTIGSAAAAAAHNFVATTRLRFTDK